MRKNEILEGKMSRAMLSFALPFMFSSLLQSIYGAVDLFVVGQYADSAAVSAVSIGSQLMLLVTALITGISMGGTVEIGVRIGEKNDEGVSNAVGNIIFLFVTMAVVITPLMLVATDGLIAVMQTPGEAVADCRKYMLICCLGLPFIVGYNAVSGIYRGIGDSKTPLSFIWIACIINVILDFLLTGYLKMGASGAASATVMAQGVSFLYAVVHMKRGGFPYVLRLNYMKPKAAVVRRILVVGLPLAIQDVLVQFSFLVIAAIVNTLGLVASAAVGVVEKLLNFAFLIPSAFGSAVATATAQNLGAGERKRAKESVRWGVIYSVIGGIFVCALCWIIPDTLIGIFSRDTAVITAGAGYVKTYSIDCIMTGFVFCINGYLNGNGKSMVCFAHSMVATFLVRIPVTWVMSKFTADSLAPMGLAAPAASIVSIVICAIYLSWMERRHSG